MNTRAIAPILALALALPIALWLGATVAQDQVLTAAWILSALFLGLCLALKQHVWILIPATLGMRGDISFIPGTPAPWILMTAAASGFTLLRLLSRQQRIVGKWTLIETSLFLVAVTIAQAFIRNPTGFRVFGGDLVGGKVYIEFAVGYIGFATIAVAQADMRSFKWVVIAYIAITMLDSVNAILSAFLPSYAAMIVKFYSNVSYEAVFMQGFTGDIEEQRVSQFGWLALLLGLIACSFWRPLAALDLRKPWRMIVALIAVAGASLSGFRNMVVAMYVYFLVGSIVRRKFADIVAVSVLGLVCMVFLSSVVQTTGLPYSVQRVLTMVPGVKVREDITRAAKNSSEARFEAWRLALTTDDWINDKIFGDGIQASARELAMREEMIINPQKASIMSPEEVMLTTGAYHGFHAETIRNTGAVGLAAATFALFVFFVKAAGHVSFFRNTKDWGFVLFICIPFLIHPFWYWLVFGDYKQDFPGLLAQAGMLKVLHNLRMQSHVPPLAS